MMAKRAAGILPSLTFDESLEVTAIHSVAGLLAGGAGLVRARPFRAPHHTISDVALVGGGSTPRPGEISLAHQGVLFLDEMPEFSRHVLEVLRQPLEDGLVRISRAQRTATFGALRADRRDEPVPVRVSRRPAPRLPLHAGADRSLRGAPVGPLRDRIDLTVSVTALPTSELMGEVETEPTAAIRARVERARAVQARRAPKPPSLRRHRQRRPGSAARTGGASAHARRAHRAPAARRRANAWGLTGAFIRSDPARVENDRRSSRVARVEFEHVAEALQFRS